MFLFDFPLFVLRLLPPFLRGPLTVGWVRALAAPLMQVYDSPVSQDAVRYPEAAALDGAAPVLAHRAHVNLRAGLTGQTVALECLLNRYYYAEFDAVQPVTAPGHLIYIEDVGTLPPINALFLTYESQPLPLCLPSEFPAPPPPPNNANPTTEGPQYFFLVDEYVPEIDFTVWVPAALVFVEAEMRSLIDRYRAAGRTYTIQPY